MIPRVAQFNHFMKVAAGRWYWEITQVLNLLTVSVLRFRTSRSETNKMIGSGSMLVMALAQARKSGDGKLLFTYYEVFRKWADYLTTSMQSNGLYVISLFGHKWMVSFIKSPTADGLLGATSNVVIKGIMGIYAMGQINKILEAVGADSSLTSHYLVSRPSLPNFQ